MKSPVDQELISHIGRQLQAARNKMGYTQPQLAEIVGLSPTYIADVEAGRYGLTPTNMRNLSRALHVSTDFLFYGEQPESDISFVIEQLQNAKPELVDCLIALIQLQIKVWSNYELSYLLKKSLPEEEPQE